MKSSARKHHKKNVLQKRKSSYLKEFHTGGTWVYTRSVNLVTLDTDLKIALKITSKHETSPSNQEALRRALERGEEMKKELVTQAGPYLDTHGVADKLQLSAQDVRTMIDTGDLIALEDRDDGVRIPAWQLSDDKILEGLSAVLEVLDASSPISMLNFFMTPDKRLNSRTPKEALLAGDIEQVRAVARTYWRQMAG